MNERLELESESGNETDWNLANGTWTNGTWINGTWINGTFYPGDTWWGHGNGTHTHTLEENVVMFTVIGASVLATLLVCFVLLCCKARNPDRVADLRRRNEEMSGATRQTLQPAAVVAAAAGAGNPDLRDKYLAPPPIRTPSISIETPRDLPGATFNSVEGNPSPAPPPYTLSSLIERL